MDDSLNPLDYPLRSQAKAVGPALATLILFILTGITTGDWTVGNTVNAAIGTVVTYLVAFYLPNR